MQHWEGKCIKAVIGRIGNCEEHKFGKKVAEKARKFHQSFPEYKSTPLAALDDLAALFGVKSIHVKDESYRFGLNAFKGLGGSFCIGNYVAQKLGMDIEDLTYEFLTSPKVK